MLSKELDRNGVPVAVVTALPQLANQVGASRVIVGRKIPHPCGDPTLPASAGLLVRRAIVLEALHALDKPISAPEIFVPAQEA